MKRVLRSARWIGPALLALINGVFGAPCAGAPLLVLRGTATVATAANGLNLDLISFSPLPLSVSVGDVFNFQLSIDTEPSPGTPTEYHATFSAHIGDVDAIDAGLIMQVMDDAFLYNQYIAQSIFDDSFPAVGDRIRSYTPTISGHLSSTPNAAFQTDFLFTSSLSLNPPFSSLLVGNQVPESTVTWQAFQQREMALSFANRSYLGAYIDTFAIVPEPSSFSVIIISTIAILGARLFCH